MSEMVEKVARAMAWRTLTEGRAATTSAGKLDAAMELDTPMVGETGLVPYWRTFIPDARAAIQAMREPTKAMVLAGYDDGEPTDCAAHWRSMIDEALK